MDIILIIRDRDIALRISGGYVIKYHGRFHIGE